MASVVADEEQVLAETSGRRTRSGRTTSGGTTSAASSSRSRRKRHEQAKDDAKEDEAREVEPLQQATAEMSNSVVQKEVAMEVEPEPEPEPELVNDQLEEVGHCLDEGNGQPHEFLLEDELEMIALPPDNPPNIDEKSSSFPFGAADNSAEASSDEPKELTDVHNVDSSLLASLAGDNANSLPSVGGSEELVDGKAITAAAAAFISGDDNALSAEDSVSQPAIAEDLAGDADLSNATIVNNDIISEDELRSVEKPTPRDVNTHDKPQRDGNASPVVGGSCGGDENVSDVKKSTNSNLRAKRKSEEDSPPRRNEKSNATSSRKSHKKRKHDEEYNPMSPTSESNDSTVMEKRVKCDDAEHKERRRDKDKEREKERDRDHREREKERDRERERDRDRSEREKDKEKEKERRKLPDLEKYWRAVKQDPTDFTAWTYLLQYVDNENDADAAREAYDTFLTQYPYCYGYWRKYADYEKRKGVKANCNAVFERGLKAIPLSVDLWIHYLAHIKITHADDDNYLRAQFERGVEACGLEFRSDKLWDAYINFENEAKRYQRTVKIYDRLLAIPTQGYAAHFEAFQDLIANQPVNCTIDSEDLLDLRQRFQSRSTSRSKHATKKSKSRDREREESSQDSGGGKSPKHKQDQHDDEEVTSTPDRAELSSAELADPSTLSEEEIAYIKDKVISRRRKIHKQAVAEVSERWTYEEGIKRPYFHVKPLERAQINNWREYLDFEIGKGDRRRILVLFERCLIACAMYDEFWLKMIRYLETINEQPGVTDTIRDVYQRACEIHHPDKPSLHLMWSAFEECQNNFSKAAEILMNVERKCPNLLQVSYRRINIERRRGDLAKCREFYRHYIDTAKSKAIAASLAIKYARFLNKICNDLEGGLRVLRDVLGRDETNTRVALQMIDLAVQRSVVNEAEVVAIMDKFMARDSIGAEERVLFAQRKVEFLEDFGSTAKGLQNAQRDLQASLAKAKEAKEKRDASGSPQKSASTDAVNAESYSNNNAEGAASTTAAADTAPNYNYATGNTAGYYGQGNNSNTYSQSYDAYYNQWQQYGSSGSTAGYNYGQWSGYGNYYQ